MQARTIAKTITCNNGPIIKKRPKEDVGNASLEAKRKRNCSLITHIDTMSPKAEAMVNWELCSDDVESFLNFRDELNIPLN